MSFPSLTRYLDASDPEVHVPNVDAAQLTHTDSSVKQDQ